MSLPDQIASALLAVYDTLAFTPPHNQHTILAGFVLSRPGKALKVISLGTGSKCLPIDKFPLRGEGLHDSHAEVLTRRGACRWLLEEVFRLHHTSHSDWLEHAQNGRFALRVDASLHLYVSTVPCGDASTRVLAAAQDAAMAALKDATPWAPLAPGTSARGRDNYALLGVLRTKPGRADAPPTTCMACSDKIAAWNVLGVQGALGAYILSPTYISTIVLGDVPEVMRESVREDCRRALFERVAGVSDLSDGYAVHRPSIEFTSLVFRHSKLALGATGNFCNDVLCWIADSSDSPQALINGAKRSTAPKHRYSPKYWPMLSKAAMFALAARICEDIGRPMDPVMTYRRVKDTALEYQAAKTALRGPERPFAGWVICGDQWDDFAREVQGR